jgi:myosin heavy subunit
MFYPNQSVREGFTPQQITHTLCKAHGVSGYYEDIEQINISAVWHSMVLDLMLANIDQSFWGWSDPDAIYLLDFWKSVDPNIAFILVYDKPESIFVHHESYLSKQDDVKDMLKSWSAYNFELLRFYQANQDRCLLVHARQVRLSAASYIQQLKVRINLKFPDKILWRGTEISCQTPKKRQKIKKEISENITSKAVSSYVDNTNDNPLWQYIAKDLVRGNRQAQNIYRELQENANLPLINEGIGGTAAIDAWQTMIEQFRRHEAQTEQIQSLTEQLNSVEQNAQETIVSLEERINKAKAEYEDAKNYIDILKQEQNKQLASLNEQSKKVSDIEKQKTELSQSLQHAKKSAEEKSKQLEQLKKELEAKSQNTSKNSELEQENELLLSQLHQVQEELEKYYLENQELKKDTKEIKSQLFGAKERVKNTLEYRIGGLMIEHWKQKGKLTLLSAVKKAQKEWKDRPNTDLPPLEDYFDANEGYKIQKHLSYRLGVTWLNHKNVLTLPNAILKDVREFREYRAGSKN